MRSVLVLVLTLALSACVGDAVRSATTGAAEIGTGAVDVVTSPIP